MAALGTPPWDTENIMEVLLGAWYYSTQHDRSPFSSQINAITIKKKISFKVSALATGYNSEVSRA